MKCDFDLNYSGTNEEQLAMLSERDYTDQLDKIRDKQERYMDFRTCKCNISYHYKHNGLNKSSSTELALYSLLKFTLSWKQAYSIRTEKRSVFCTW